MAITSGKAHAKRPITITMTMGMVGLTKKKVYKNHPKTSPVNSPAITQTFQISPDSQLRRAKRGLLSRSGLLKTRRRKIFLGGHAQIA